MTRTHCHILINFHHRTLENYVNEINDAFVLEWTSGRYATAACTTLIGLFLPDDLLRASLSFRSKNYIFKLSSLHSYVRVGKLTVDMSEQS